MIVNVMQSAGEEKTERTANGSRFEFGLVAKTYKYE